MGWRLSCRSLGKALSQISSRGSGELSYSQQRRPLPAETPQQLGQAVMGDSLSPSSLFPSRNCCVPFWQAGKHCVSYLGSLSALKRRIWWDASLSGACGASSRRTELWRRSRAREAAGRGHIGCCKVSATLGTRRRSWLKSVRGGLRICLLVLVSAPGPGGGGGGRRQRRGGEGWAWRTAGSLEEDCSEGQACLCSRLEEEHDPS